MDKKYNLKVPGVKRLMREATELKDPTPMYYAQPLEDNLFEWHFTVLAPPETDFEGGIYHGRILLPTEYPMKPPSIIMLTPNGRFEVQHKICLSASAYHPELWQPSWSIRTVLLALIGFMPTEGVGAIGSLDSPPEERRRLAARSLEWVCPICLVPNKAILPPMEAGQQGQKKQEEALAEAADIVSQMAFKDQIAQPSTSVPKSGIARPFSSLLKYSFSPLQPLSEAEVKTQKKKLAALTSPQDISSSSSSRQPTPSSGPRSRLHPHPSQPTDATSIERTQDDTPVASSPAPNVSTVPPTVKQASIHTIPVDIPRRQSRGARFGSLVLIWILLLAIGLLMLRRLLVVILGL